MSQSIFGQRNSSARCATIVLARLIIIRAQLWLVMRAIENALLAGIARFKVTNVT